MKIEINVHKNDIPLAQAELTPNAADFIALEKITLLRLNKPAVYAAVGMVAICVTAALTGFLIVALIAGLVLISLLTPLLTIKKIASAKLKASGGKRLYRFFADGFTCETENKAIFLPYDKITASYEKNGRLYVFAEEKFPHIIPTEALDEKLTKLLMR